MMREFVCLFRVGAAEQREAMGTPERARQSLERWSAWIHELESRGHLKNRGQPLEPDGRVIRGRTKTVTDGPYVETKDLVAGFITVVARDLDEAVALTRDCPLLDGGGSIEVRAVGRL
jgi:hypothetical protein